MSVQIDDRQRAGSSRGREEGEAGDRERRRGRQRRQRKGGELSLGEEEEEEEEGSILWLVFLRLTTILVSAPLSDSIHFSSRSQLSINQHRHVSGRRNRLLPLHAGPVGTYPSMRQTKESGGSQDKDKSRMDS